MTSEIGSDQCHHVTSLEARHSHQISATEKTRSELAELYSPEIQSRGDLSVLLPVFPQRGKQNKNTRDERGDPAATRLENIN